MAKIGITGELESKTTEGKLVDASQVKDISRGNKSLKEINDNIFKSIEDSVLPNINTALDTDAIIITIDNENGEKSTTIPTATTETAGVMSASDKKAFNNPLGLSTTVGVEEFISFVLGDEQAHEVGVRQVVKSSGRLAFADLTLGADLYFAEGEANSNPTGIRKYWLHTGIGGKNYVYYARINWDIVKEVSWIKDVTQITEFFTLQPAVPVALSVAGSSLLNMLQSLDYDITETEYNSDGIAKKLSVEWRDGTSGTVTYSDYRADVLEYGILAVTYNSYVKVVQVREYSETGDVIKRTTTIKYKDA